MATDIIARSLASKALKQNSSGVGEAAGFGTPTVTIESLPIGAEPEATIIATGPDTAKEFTFDFKLPKGPKGDPGKTGPIGPQGDIGPCGPQGNKGPRGIQGPIGIRGPIGEAGLQGPQGIQGQKGDKGDPGQGFQIYKIYSSIEELKNGYADSSDVPVGGFVIIASQIEDPDNAKLYLKTNTEFKYIMDMSGMTGIQGPKGDQGEPGIQGPAGPAGEIGPEGPKGDEGYIPVKGEDYFTEQDILDIVSKIDKTSLGLEKVDNIADVDKFVKHADIASSVDWNDVENKPSSYYPMKHNHNDLYYSKNDVNIKLQDKIDKNIIPKATEEDTLQVHVKPDGTLWVKPSSIMPPTPPVKPGKTYTVKIQLNNDNPETACTYADDAVGITPGYKGWKNTTLFKSIKPCIVKDGVFQYYLNPDNLSQKENGEPVDITSVDTGDVMIEIPKIGYKMWNDDQYQYVSVTEERNKTNYCYRAHSLDTEGDCDKIYIGAFLGWNDKNKIYSLPGKSPVTYISLSTARNATQSKGTGYQLTSFYPVTLLQCLYLIKYKNMNSQAAIGKGFSYENSEKAYTGGTISKGEDYGEAVGHQQMCFCNIEDFWGNINWFVDGAFINDSGSLVTAFNGFNNTGNGYPYIKYTGRPDNFYGYVSGIQGTNESGFTIKSNNGSGSTYYTDRGYITYSCNCKIGGDWKSKTDDGAFRMLFTDSASTTYPNLGCRIMFKHKEVTA